MPGLCCDLGGYAGNKPGTTFLVHKNNRREEVITSIFVRANSKAAFSLGFKAITLGNFITELCGCAQGEPVCNSNKKSF